LWWDSSDDAGVLFIWYDDADGGQWVETSGTGQDVPLWTRTGTTLSPATVGDGIDVKSSGFFSGSATGADTNAVNIGTWAANLGGIQFNRNGTTGAITNLTLGTAEVGLSDGFIALKTGEPGGGAHTERVRISGGGLFLGGTLPASPNITLNANGNASFVGAYATDVLRVDRAPGGVCFVANSPVGSNIQIDLTASDAIINNSAGGSGLIMRAAGNGVVLYPNGTSWNPVTSESRLKDIQPDPDVDQCWDLVRDIQLKRYFYKDQDDKTGISFMGPMADWVGVQDPELLIDTGESDEHGPIHTYNQGLLDMKALAALSAALKRIEALEAKLAALEGGTN
jgi:hypothetical protein